MTSRERAEIYLDSYFCDSHDKSDIDTLEIYFEDCKKEQDKKTREQCAHNVMMIECELEDYDNFISSPKAYLACINTKAV